MKRVFTIFMMLALLVCACEKETILTVDQSSVSFTDAGGSQTVTLTTNKPWTVKADQSWCKISPSGGEEASSSRITITCDANAAYDARNCTVTFTCAGLTKTISVSQATNNGLIVSQTTYELTKAAQQVNIEVKANVKFSVEVDSACKDWIKYNATKALSTSTVVLDIAENATYDNREGKVTIKQTDGSLSSTITIKQSQVDGLFITTPEYNLSNEQHTLTVAVSTNVAFEVKPDVDWVKYVETKALNSRQIVLDIAENETSDSREAKVSVKQRNGDLSGMIVVKQTGRIAVESILLDRSELEIMKGNIDTLHAMILPENASNQNVMWSSIDSTIASVHNGIITALNSGLVEIKASVEDKSATCKVTVIVPVESIKLSKSSLTLVEGDTETLDVSIIPIEAATTPVTWSSSDSEIATIDDTGKVTALQVGSTIITAKAGEKTSTCAVTVVIPATSISLNYNTALCLLNKTIQFVATITPDNASERNVIWTSTDENVVTIDNNGLAKCIKVGSADVIARVGSVSASCKVIVLNEMGGTTEGTKNENWD